MLPLRSPPGGRRFIGIEAVYTEEALRGARAGDAVALGRLFELTRPEVADVARALWSPSCPLPVEELQAVGLAHLVDLQAWTRFEPGRARGRTLWPAYARRLARQGMGVALGEAGPVHVARHARRRLEHLKAVAEREGRDVLEVLAERPKENAARAIAGGLPIATDLEHASHVAEDTTDAEERAQQAIAVARLARLPVRERVAVAGPLGLLREGRLSDAKLSRHLKCSLEEVLDLRERGLERLREAMGA